MTRIVALARQMRRFWARSDGTATVEFAIMFPIVISFLIMGAEAGFTAVQRISLERGVDIAVRDIRLGSLPAGTTHDEFRSRICERVIALADCEERLLLELRVISTNTWALPIEQSTCIDLAEAIAPVTPFTVGAGENVMYLRACYLVSPIFPTTTFGLQLPLDSSGMFALRTSTGFVNE